MSGEVQENSVQTEFMSYELYLPDDFHTWGPEAQRAWLAGGLTQRQMLNYATDQLGLSLEYDGRGTLTNRDLAEFVVALTRTRWGSAEDV